MPRRTTVIAYPTNGKSVRGPKKNHPADATPDPFAFTALTGVARGSRQSAGPFTVSGLSEGETAPLSLTGGTYVKNDAGETGADTTIQNDDVLTFYATASSSFFTETQLITDANGVLSIWSIRTQSQPSQDSTPDDFSFAPQADATRSQTYRATPFEVGGLGEGVEVAASAEGGDLVVGGEVVASASVGNGALVTIDVTASGAYATPVAGRVTLGNKSALYTVTTEDAPAPEPSDEILFGIKTRAGFGGVNLNLPAGGTNSADWLINTYGEEAPSGTYGATKTYAKAAGESYTGLTSGGGSVQTTTLVAGVAHVAASSLDTAGSFQLQTQLGTAGAVALGDEIVCRDGHLNPTAQLWRFGRPPAGWSGSGRITVRAENANGHRIGALCANTNLDVEFPITFEDVSFFTAYNASHTNLLGYSNTVGYGLSATRCRFEHDAAVEMAFLTSGMMLRGGTVEDCHFKRLANGIMGGKNGRPTIITGCTFEQMVADCMSLGAGANLLTIEDNTGFDFPFISGAHPDFLQVQVWTGGNLTDFGSIRRNLCARNVSAMDPATGLPHDSQFIFLQGVNSGFTVTGAFIENNGAILTAQNGITAGRFDGPVIRFNTLVTQLNPLGNGQESTLAMSFSLSNCTNLTATHNIACGYIGMTASDADHNLTLARNPTAYGLMFPNLVSGANPGQNSRAAILHQLTPANRLKASGGAVWPDGQVSGMLFPAVSGQTIGAWNDGTVFAPEDPVWLAAHPPAA